MDTWIIERSTTFEFTSTEGGTVADTSRTTEEFAPSIGLFVHRHIEGGPSAGDLTLVS